MAILVGGLFRTEAPKPTITAWRHTDPTISQNVTPVRDPLSISMNQISPSHWASQWTLALLVGIGLVSTSWAAHTPKSEAIGISCPPNSAPSQKTKAKDKQKNKTKAKGAACKPEPRTSARTYALHEGARQAADAIAERNGISRAWVRATLAQALMLPEVVRAVTPAQDPGVRHWDAYRQRNLDPVRLQAGVDFWQRNAKTLAQAEQQTGVPAHIVVGILGVETIYGKRMGKYRVLDALSTLAFDFPTSHPKAPARAAYFLQELEAYLLWCKQPGRDPLTVRGSYAGAMGMAQFMPSSWQKYAVDFDSDGTIDLFGSSADAIGSVAHYLAAFGWKAGVPTHFSVQLEANRADLPALLEKDIWPSMTAATMAERGVLLPASAIQYAGLMALVELKNGADAAPTYVAGTDNFYTVTRYNWSSFYAMAVIELGLAVQAQMRGDVARP